MFRSAMQKNPSQTINQVLSGDCGKLGTVLRRARYLRLLTETLRNQLPLSLRAHCSVTDIKDCTLVVCADSPAWANKLRFYAPTIVAHLRQQPQLGQLQHMRVKISPPLSAPAVNLAARPAAGSNTAAILEGCANAISDLHLKQALQRLANRARIAARE